MIDVVGKARVQISKRIVGKGGQVNDAIEPGKIRSHGVARILTDGWHVRQAAAGGKGAARIEIAVQANHLMASLNKHRRKNRADIAQMSSHQDTHRLFS
jgi:hypothetical protein